MTSGYLYTWLVAWLCFSRTANKGAVNLAKGKPAWQSSTWDSRQWENAPYYANKSVDGQRKTNIKEGSCSSTKRELNPWWAVNLGEKYCITRVDITWRDFQSSSQNGVFLSIGTYFNTTTHRHLEFHQCVQIYGATSGHTTSFDCSGIAGSFVRLYRESRSRKTLIQMCEVEVGGYKGICAVNLALGRSAWQTSNWQPEASADKAVDGNKDTEYYHFGCSHTKDMQAGSPVWWIVSLGQEYYITSVTITWRNRYAWSMNGAEIIIGRHFNGSKFERKQFSRCAKISGAKDSHKKSFSCQDVKGSYVGIYRLATYSKRNLQMCEVEVWGFLGPQQLIHQGMIYQFNHKVVPQHNASQICQGQNQTLLVGSNLKETSVSLFVSRELKRIGLSHTWINKTEMGCSYFTDSRAIKVATCDDRYGFVCVVGPSDTVTFLPFQYYIYGRKMNFMDAQQVCRSTAKDIVLWREIEPIKEKVTMNNMERIWIKPRDAASGNATQNCIALRITSGSQEYANCSDYLPFVCVKYIATTISPVKPSVPAHGPTVHSTAIITGSDVFLPSKIDKYPIYGTETGLITTLILLVALTIIIGGACTFTYFIRARKFRDVKRTKTCNMEDAFDRAVNIVSDGSNEPFTPPELKNEMPTKGTSSNLQTQRHNRSEESTAGNEYMSQGVHTDAPVNHQQASQYQVPKINRSSLKSSGSKSRKTAEDYSTDKQVSDTTDNTYYNIAAINQTNLNQPLTTTETRVYENLKQ